MLHHFHCCECGQDKAHESDVSTGYAITADGHKVCFACCAVRDRQTMIDTGHSKNLPLYLSGKEVTNWPGTLRFEVFGHRTSRHNVAGVRQDVWFHGPDGHMWHGVQIGRWTQVCHCRRTKDRVAA